MKRNMEYFAIGTLVGLAVGVVLGLLFAPTSGDRLRRNLADQATKAGEAARDLALKTENVAGGLAGRVSHILGRDEEAARRKILEIRKGVDTYTQTQSS